MSLTNIFFNIAVWHQCIFCLVLYCIICSLYGDLPPCSIKILRRWTMISQIVMIIALISIWLSLAWGLVILFSAVHFWFKHSDFRVNTESASLLSKSDDRRARP